MKYLFILIILFVLVTSFANAQITNNRSGIWSDATIWSSNSVPNVNDNVLLNYDVIINGDAYCRSLNSNGHNVTVNPGGHLYITGINENADTLLSRYTIIDTTILPVPDTFKIINFYYDSLKRNISLVSSEYSSNGIVWYKFAENFFYNGNNRQPFMSSGYSVIYSGMDSSVYYYKNFPQFVSNKLVYNSSISYSINPIIGDTNFNKYLYSYTYLPDTIIKRSINLITNDTTVSRVYVQYDINGNIIRQLDTLASANGPNYYYVFDNHPNPFNKTNLNLYRVLNVAETFVEESFAKNNMLSVNQTEDGIQYNSYYRYGYKTNGYPKEVWGYDPANPTVVRSGKGLFIYTR